MFIERERSAEQFFNLLVSTRISESGIEGSNGCLLLQIITFHVKEAV